jgi:hypothetical protein
MEGTVMWRAARISFLFVVALTTACAPATGDASEGEGEGEGEGGGGGVLAPDTLIMYVNGDFRVMDVSQQVLNNLDGLPANAVYTGFFAQGGGQTVAITIQGDDAGTFTCNADDQTRVLYSDTRDLNNVVGFDSRPTGSCTIAVSAHGGAGGLLSGSFSASDEGIELTDGFFSVRLP